MHLAGRARPGQAASWQSKYARLKKETTPKVWLHARMHVESRTRTAWQGHAVSPNVWPRACMHACMCLLTLRTSGFLAIAPAAPAGTAAAAGAGAGVDGAAAAASSPAPALASGSGTAAAAAGGAGSGGAGGASSTHQMSPSLLAKPSMSLRSVAHAMAVMAEGESSSSAHMPAAERQAGRGACVHAHRIRREWLACGGQPTKAVQTAWGHDHGGAVRSDKGRRHTRRARWGSSLPRQAVGQGLLTPRRDSPSKLYLAVAGMLARFTYE